jgi:hypothetical protein
MKKWFYYCILAVLVSTGLWAEYVEIGGGTVGTSYVPVYGYYDYSWSRVIYLASELGEAKEITKVSYQLYNDPSGYVMPDQKIYMKHTTDATFANGSYEDVSTYTECFNGTITWTGVQGDWFEITLDTPFQYNGTDNLVIYWQNYDGDYASGYPRFYYKSTTYRSTHKYQDNSFPAINGSLSSYLPNTRLHYVDNPLPVTLTSFTATVAQETTANIQWTVESESGLVGYYVYRSDSDLLHAAAISYLIQADNTPFSHSYSFVDDELEYEHTYNYWLESVGSDGSTSQWGPQHIVLEGAPAPQLPEVTALGNNYPNPFNPTTVLKLNVKENEEGKLEIFNSRGQCVVTKRFAPGYHEYEWDAEGNASGLYFYRLSSPSYQAVKKMMLLK